MVALKRWSLKQVWLYFFLLMLVFVLGWLSFLCKFLSCSCFSFHCLSVKLKTGCPVLLHNLYLFLCWLKWLLWSFETCSMENVFKLNAFAAAHTAFCEWIQVGIDLYVPPYVYIFFICTNRIPYQIRRIAWTILTLPLQYYMSSIALGRSWSWQSASSVNCLV